MRCFLASRALVMHKVRDGGACCPLLSVMFCEAKAHFILVSRSRSPAENIKCGGIVSGYRHGWYHSSAMLCSMLCYFEIPTSKQNI